MKYLAENDDLPPMPCYEDLEKDDVFSEEVPFINFPHMRKKNKASSISKKFKAKINPEKPAPLIIGEDEEEEKDIVPMKLSDKLKNFSKKKINTPKIRSPMDIFKKSRAPLKMMTMSKSKALDNKASTALIKTKSE